MACIHITPSLGDAFATMAQLAPDAQGLAELADAIPEMCLLAIDGREQILWWIEDGPSGFSIHEERPSDAVLDLISRLPEGWTEEDRACKGVADLLERCGVPRTVTRQSLGFLEAYSRL
ncbi:hypothetical protein [Streptomyces fractus]|uniref:hypothetical protein n=1 Tax=Streptomyces fractus TaxID=641806 RepID=UPI003CEF0147